MQPKSYEEESNNDPTTDQNVTKNEVSKELDVQCKGLTNVRQYAYPRGTGTEPQVRETVTESKGGQRPQRVRSAVHALAGTSFSGERPSVEQQSIPSYSGFESCLLPYTKKAKRTTMLPTMNQQRTKKDEQAVQDLILCMDDSDTDSFD